MYMRVPFKVVYDDAREVKVVAKLRDVIEFERTYGVAYSHLAIRGEGREEWWAFLAWKALHRTGKDTRTYEMFVDDVASIELLPEEEPEKAPFDKAPTDGSSPDLAPQE
jgi:hypothetical protein